MTQDRVERLVADFARMRPDVNSANKEVAARLLHLSDLIQRYYGMICDRFDVSLSGLGVVTALARSAPRQLTLAELNQDILVTSGGITFVVARLERHGLLVKRSNPADGRSVLVQLTGRGRRLADQLIGAIARADSAALDFLDARDLVRFNTLLKGLESGIDTAMVEQHEPGKVSRFPTRSIRTLR